MSLRVMRRNRAGRMARPRQPVRRLIAGLGVAALLLAGVAAADEPQPVTWQPLSALLTHAEREAPAAALSLNESRIASEVTARVHSIPVQVGEVVEAGAVLIELEPHDAELALKRAQAALDSVRARIRLAEFQLQRARELHTRSFVSEDTLTQRETELDVLRAERAGAEAQLASARRELDKCTVRAPYRAIVHERSAQVGERAAPGTPLLTLIDVSRIEVSAQIQPKDAASLQSAEAVAFVAPGGEHPLQLLRISPAIDRATRIREARLQFTAAPAAPGTEGRIRWRGDGDLLPADLLSRREGHLGVFVADGDTARFIVLEQAQEGRPVAIDLAPDTRIILDGRFGLQDGRKIIERQPKAPAAAP